MIQKLLLSLFSVFLVASVAALSLAAPYDVFVPNSQFDRLNNGTAITGKQNNLSTVWAWDGGGGVETTVRAFVGPQQTIYTYLPQRIEVGDTWSLDANSFAGWPNWADDLEARLFWYDGSVTRNTIASQSTTAAGPMNVTFSAADGDAFIGKNIGIEFYSPIASGGWTQVDNLSLSVDPGPRQYIPIPVANHSFENGQTSWGFSGGGVTDHDGESDGIYAAWFGSGVGAWQGLGEIIEDGATYQLLLDTHLTGGSGPELTVNLFSYESGDDLSNPANRNALETIVVAGLTGTLQTLEMTYVGDSLADGMLLGVDFSNTGSGWLGVDNVRMSSIAAAAVPEPSTFALAALGLLGLAWRGWRKRR